MSEVTPGQEKRISIDKGREGRLSQGRRTPTRVRVRLGFLTTAKQDCSRGTVKVAVVVPTIENVSVDCFPTA